MNFKKFFKVDMPQDSPDTTMGTHEMISIKKGVKID
jgi:hypothetical protein